MLDLEGPGPGKGPVRMTGNKKVNCLACYPHLPDTGEGNKDL